MNIIFGAKYDEKLNDLCMITVIATGIDEKNPAIGRASAVKARTASPVMPQKTLKPAYMPMETVKFIIS